MRTTCFRSLLQTASPNASTISIRSASLQPFSPEQWNQHREDRIQLVHCYQNNVQLQEPRSYLTADAVTFAFHARSGSVSSTSMSPTATAAVWLGRRSPCTRSPGTSPLAPPSAGASSGTSRTRSGSPSGSTRRCSRTSSSGTRRSRRWGRRTTRRRTSCCGSCSPAT